MNAVNQRLSTNGQRREFDFKLRRIAYVALLSLPISAWAQDSTKAVPPAQNASNSQVSDVPKFEWTDATRSLFGETPRPTKTPTATQATTPTAIPAAIPAKPATQPIVLPPKALSVSKPAVVVAPARPPANIIQPAEEVPDFVNADDGSYEAEKITPPEVGQTNSNSVQEPSAPWWASLVRESMFTTASEKITPDYLVYQALQNSPFIRAISRDPLIREQEVTEADAEFDPELFAKSLYDDKMDPVGNTLTTSERFLKENVWTGQAGLRRKLQTGGDVEISQKLGFQNSNQRFFEPQDQGTATLAISLNQPLLRGGGRLYNRSQIMIAQASQQAAWQTFLVGFQDELIKIGEAYWNLNYRRSILLQKQRNVKRGADILAKLQGRSDLDSVPSQVLRAQAAVASRETELSNALRDVENAQTEIRRLIGDRDGLTTYNIELIPAESPNYAFETPGFEQLIQEALQNRSEIREAVQRAKIAAIENDIGRNEMLPELNLILKSYLSALEGDSGVEAAWQQQWVNSAPGFAAGLEYTLPYGRRVSKSRLSQRQIKLQKVNEEIEVSLLAVVSETQVAARHLDSAYKTMQAAAGAIKAATADLEYQGQRWEAFALVEGDFSEGQTPVTLLDQLLDAQQRLSNAESIYSQSEFDFKKAQLALKRATGTILQHERIEFSSACVDNVPTLQIDQHNR